MHILHCESTPHCQTISGTVSLRRVVRSRGGARNFGLGSPKIQGGPGGRGTRATRTKSLDLHPYRKCHEGVPSPPPPLAVDLALFAHSLVSDCFVVVCAVLFVAESVARRCVIFCSSSNSTLIPPRRRRAVQFPTSGRHAQGSRHCRVGDVERTSRQPSGILRTASQRRQANVQTTCSRRQLLLRRRRTSAQRPSGKTGEPR